MEYACGLRMFARNIFTLESKYETDARVSGFVLVCIVFRTDIPYNIFIIKSDGESSDSMIRPATLTA